jgi:hypothetical protein
MRCREALAVRAAYDPHCGELHARIVHDRRLVRDLLRAGILHLDANRVTIRRRGRAVRGVVRYTEGAIGCVIAVEIIEVAHFRRAFQDEVRVSDVVRHIHAKVVDGKAQGLRKLHEGCRPEDMVELERDRRAVRRLHPQGHLAASVRRERLDSHRCVDRDSRFQEALAETLDVVGEPVALRIERALARGARALGEPHLVRHAKAQAQRLGFHEIQHRLVVERDDAVAGYHPNGEGVQGFGFRPPHLALRRREYIPRERLAELRAEVLGAVGGALPPIVADVREEAGQPFRALGACAEVDVVRARLQPPAPVESGDVLAVAFPEVPLGVRKHLAHDAVDPLVARFVEQVHAVIQYPIAWIPDASVCASEDGGAFDEVDLGVGSPALELGGIEKAGHSTARYRVTAPHFSMILMMVSE